MQYDPFSIGSNYFFKCIQRFFMKAFYIDKIVDHFNRLF